MSKPIYVLSGPNLNLLGTREPEIYGHQTLDDVRGLCEARAKSFGFEVVFRQSNHEGELVDWIQEARQEACALVLNPAAREAFRRETYVSLAATGLVSGFGAKSYELAVEAAAGLAR